ncbi:hypothetical protein As57867_004123, partial [Aphanomyces stellatus]
MLRSTQPKYATFEAPLSTPHPRQTASLFSQTFLTWCLPLVRQSQQINIQDTWPLEDVNTAETNTHLLADTFQRTHSIFWAAMHAFGRPFFLVGFLTLLLELLQLAGPIVLQKVIADVSGDATSLYYWLGALLVAKLLGVILWCHSNMLEMSLTIRFVGGLKGLLFQKLLSQASHSDDGDVPDLANIYSADIDALVWAAESLHNLWILPLQVLVVSYFLYQEIGLAAFAGLGMIVLSLGLGMYISTIESSAYDKLSTARDDRMQAVKETFGSILVVKLHAWEQKCREKIQKLRDIELGHVWSFMASGALSVFTLWATPLFVSMSSFAVYTMVLNQQLTPAKVFTSLALFRVLQEPIYQIPTNITGVVEAQVSLQRIVTYLTQSDQPLRPTPITTPAASTMVAIENGSFAWGTDNQTPILTNISLTISRGDLVVVHGKVGSGKSSLCHAILGEMTQTQGTTGVYGSIAYASQEAWIQQMSVRDNILFGAPFDSAKYTRVVDACGLLPDFALMKFGDMTA